MEHLHHRIRHHIKHHVLPFSKVIFWFAIGATLGIIFLCSFLYILYQHTYENKVYPGISIDGVDFSGQTKEQVRHYFQKKNQAIALAKITFVSGDTLATSSAQTLQLGYNTDLLATQAISTGRTDDIITNTSLLLQAYIYGSHLSSTYSYNDESLNNVISPLAKQINVDPVNAIFTVTNNKVSAFQLSQDGKRVDMDRLKNMLTDDIPQMLRQDAAVPITIHIPIETVKPQVSSQSINKYGISELVAAGTSLFAGSIPSRVFNIGLAASRINGALVPPGQVFSFDQTVGDISALSGYKQAYVITNGHTVLGDGGGVCQVSTTLFRAILNAGLPIVERHAHAYEVHYYTEDAPLGLDAAIYSPTVDLKFKNDTSHYIMIHTIFDGDNNRLTFELYGTKDGREVSIGPPVITSQSPAPAPLYQDDPTLPKGQEVQTDFAAPGANVYFTRTVTQNGKVIITDKFVSNFQPWQAVYRRGTM